MLFQESALFDSLTVAENVGHKLYEETDMPLDQYGVVSRRCFGSSGWRNTSTECRRTYQADSVGGSRLRVRWPHGPGCCSSMSRPPASIRLRPRR